MLSGDNGILNRATDSKGQNAEAQAIEKTKVAYMAVRTEIASQQAIDGNYDPTSRTTTGTEKSNYDKLVDVVLKDIPNGNGWTVTPGTSGSTIAIEYYDDSLNSSDHKSKFTITITNSEPYAVWAQSQAGFNSTN